MPPHWLRLVDLSPGSRLLRQLAATVRLLMRLHSEWALPNIIGGNHKINREGGSQSRFEAKTAMDAPVEIPKASLPGPLSAASLRPEHGCDALTRRRRWRSCSRWPRLLCYSARLDILCQFEECSGIGYTNVCCRDFVHGQLAQAGWRLFGAPESHPYQ